MRPILLSILLLLTGCQEGSNEVASFTSEAILGRDQKHLVYRAKVPTTWKAQLPSKTTSRSDTTEPLIAYRIADDIRITVHSFPKPLHQEGIPPMAQVYRWQRQLEHGQNPFEKVEPLSQNGFFGLYYEGIGQNGILAWAMQIDPLLGQYLAACCPMSEAIQSSADYTIKAIGPAALIQKHKQEIQSFAKSFELIREIN